MKPIPLILLTLMTSLLLASCATSTNGHVSDAGREVHNEDGYTTLQQSIRF